MPTDFDLAFAEPGDDAQLRALFAATPTPGRIELAYHREPDFFASIATEGQWQQVFVARHQGRVVGSGVRAGQPRHVDGQVREIGYLSGLRLAPAFRGRALPLRAFRFLRDAHADGRVPYYLTTVAEGNPALRLFTAGARGMPRYVPCGRYVTYALPLGRRRRVTPPPGVDLRVATPSDEAAIVAFLNRMAAQHQFAPVYPERLFNNPQYRGVRPDDLWLAHRHGRLAGVLGSWDQHAFRQARVVRYHGLLGLARPAVNLWLRARGRTPLPASGEAFRYRLGVFGFVEGHDTGVFGALLDHLLAGGAPGPAGLVMVGAHETEPWHSELASRCAARYETRLFLVTWAPDALPVPSRARPVHLELGCL